MRNHDLVSDAFLALIAASLVLLSSSLLAFATCEATVAALLWLTYCAAGSSGAGDGSPLVG